MAINGPLIQLPPANAPFSTQTDEGQHSLSPEAASFLHAVQQVIFYSTRSGGTASRPTGTTQRWIGMPYFDTTLGKTVYLKIASTNVWVDGSGAVV